MEKFLCGLVVFLLTGPAVSKALKGTLNTDVSHWSGFILYSPIALLAAAAAAAAQSIQCRHCQVIV